MKLQAIKKACNARKTFLILNCPSGQQWIGNGFACWPVEGITVTTEAIQAIFEIPQEKREEYDIREGEKNDERLSIVPAEKEIPLEDLGDVLDHGIIYKILRAPDGIMAINTDYIKPADKKDADLRYFLRPKDGRNPIIAVYADMFVSGIIMQLNGMGTKIIKKNINSIFDHPVFPIGDGVEEGEEK